MFSWSWTRQRAARGPGQQERSRDVMTFPPVATLAPQPSRHRCTKLFLAAVLAFVLSAPSVAASAAPATVVRDSITSPILVKDLPDDCRPNVTGTPVGTEVFSYTSIKTAQGFEIHGAIVDTARITWDDGTYTLTGSTDHFSFTSHSRTDVYTVAHEDHGSTYAADGTFLLHATFHLVEHFTVTADGVVRAEFERGHFNFFHGC